MKTTLSIAAVAASLLAGPSPAAAMGPCVEVPAYAGKNGVPRVTSEIFPSSGGDTVVNDLDCLPGNGRLVLVGSWEHPADYKPAPGENPCAGEPEMKIVYPIDFGAKTCYCWKHWVSRTDLHSNSASHFVCGKGSLSYTQWHTDLVCGKSGSTPEPGESKTVYTTQCCQDTPNTIWSQILDFSGCPAK